MRAAENAAVRRKERRQSRQRVLTCAGLILTAVGLLVLSALMPGERPVSAREQTAMAVAAYPAEEAFSGDETGRKDWCYTFLILCRDENAEELYGTAVGMLDRKEKSLSVVTVPGDLLVETGTGVQSLEEVYAHKGAYGVKERMAGLLGYPVDHYVSLTSETAAKIFRLLDDGTVFLPPVGEQSGAWREVLESSLAEGYIRNKDGVISYLTGESVTSLTEENLRWYARELLKLSSGKVSLYALPAAAFSAETEDVVLRLESWVTLLNEAFNPSYEPIAKENIRAAAAGR